jgi:hypothetical protein
MLSDSKRRRSRGSTKNSVLRSSQRQNPSEPQATPHQFE